MRRARLSARLRAARRLCADSPTATNDASDATFYGPEERIV
jgi:hypothetical protein